MVDRADNLNRPLGAVTFHWFGDSPPPALSLAEQIALAIGERVVSGDYPPGSRITEQDMASEFHVSRGPIREALRMLERTRLVQISPRHGAKVAHLSLADLHEIIELCAALQRIGARRLARLQPPAAMKVLKTGVNRLEELACGFIDVSEFVTLEFELHVRCARLAGNPRRADLLGSLLLEVMPYRRSLVQLPDVRRRVVLDWHDLADAICRGDAQGAVDLVDRADSLLRDVTTGETEMGTNAAVRLYGATKM